MGVLKESIPDKLRVFFYNCISASYKLNEALANTEYFNSIIAKETKPHTLRMLVEQTLELSAGQVDGLTARFVPNKVRNSHHVELKYGNMVFTANKLSHILGKIQDVSRPARFRSNLNADNNTQMELFTTKKKIIEGILHVNITYRGIEFPEKVQLQIVNAKNKPIDRYDLVLSEKEKQTDEEIINGYPIEFKDLIKRASSK